MACLQRRLMKLQFNSERRLNTDKTLEASLPALFAMTANVAEMARADMKADAQGSREVNDNVFVLIKCFIFILTHRGTSFSYEVQNCRSSEPHMKPDKPRKKEVHQL